MTEFALIENGRAAASGGARRRAVDLLVHGTAWLLTAVGLPALAIHFTVRDGLLITQPVFFATAPLVLAASLLIAAGCWWKVGRPAAALVVGILSCACFAWFGAHFFRSDAPLDLPAPERIRILLWNGQYRLLRDAETIEQIKQLDPDIIAMIEATRKRRRLKKLRQQHFPDYQMSPLHCGIVLFCRGELESARTGELHGRSLYQHSVARVRGARLHFILADIASNPFKSRRPAMSRLEEVLQQQPPQAPVVLLGDFNMPAQSVCFDPLRRRFSNAFESKGQGYAATWPMPAPVLQLDQVWVNHRLQVASCRALWSWWSDHRPVVVEVGLTDE